MATKKVYFPTKEETTIITPLTGCETIGEMKAKIDEFASQNQSVLFNTATIDVSPRLYTCNIFIDTAKNTVRVSDTASGRLYIGPYAADETVKDVISKAVDPYVSITIEVVNALGTPVYGKTARLREGGYGGEIKEELSYEGKPVTFMVERGFNYFVEILGSEEALTTSGIAYDPVVKTLRYMELAINDFGDVKSVVNYYETVEGGIDIAKQILVGKVINDVWVDLDSTATSSNTGDAEPKTDAQNHPRWLDPMVCTDVQEVEDADGNKHLGAVMMRQYATRYTMVFDAPNQEIADEDVAQEGVYYYGFAPAYDPTITYKANNCVKVDGVIYAAKAAISTPEEWTPDHWKVVTAPQTGDSTKLLAGIAAGDPLPYDAYDRIYRNAYRDATQNIIVYGHNRYETSAYRQYLNSDAEKGQFWSQNHIGQVRPSSYNYHGYMAGCSPELLSAVKAVKRNCVSNTVCDGGAEYTVCDKFYLPAVVEMFGTDYPSEGSQQFEYWRLVTGNPNATPADNSSALNDYRKIRSVNAKTGSAVALRCRSANRGYSGSVWYVYTSGSLGNYIGSAHYPYAAVPACVIY